MRVILLDTEAGSSSVADLIAAGKVERFDCSTFERFEQCAWALQFGQIKGDLVVVDTVSSVTDRFVRDVTIDPGDLNPQAGKTYWSLRNKMRQSQDVWNRVNPAMTAILTLIRELPIPSIFTVHERERDDFTQIENEEEPRRNMPALPRRILLNVMGGSDMVVRLYKTVTPTYWEGQTYPANTRVLQIENTADAVTGVRLTPEQDAKLPRRIYDPTLAKLAAALGGLPRKLAVYSFPKVGKTVFGCTLP